MATIQVWQVVLDVDGERREVLEEVPEVHGNFHQLDAEVGAIKRAETEGGKKVRCTFSRWLHNRELD